MKKDRKFMSSKQIYFLPMINKIHSNRHRKSFDVHHSPSKFKSIEQIMHDKSMSQNTQYNVSLELLKRPKAHASDNLYNKYELLPRIMAKKLKRKQQNKAQTYQHDSYEQLKKQKRVQEAKLEKQNTITFNSSFYQRQFKQLLSREVNKLQFQLAPSYSTHNLLMSKYLQDEPLVHLRDFHQKYTKIHITEPEEVKEHLGKVPDFLLRLLEPCRK